MRLGGSAVEVTPLSLGGAVLAGLYAPVSATDATAIVHRSLDRGLRYIDTAPHYGGGMSEARIGAALTGDAALTGGGALSGGAALTGGAALSGGGSGVTISTKVGRLLRPRRDGEEPDDSGFPGEPAIKREWDFSASGIRRSLESSLDRLGLDRVDIAYIHDPDDHEEQVYAEAYPALVRLRDEGLIGAIGVGMNQTAMLTRFVRRLDLDVVLCAGRYTLLDRSAADDLLPACADRGTSVVIGGVYNSGLLAGGGTYDYAPAPPDVLAHVARLRKACDAYRVPLRAAALRFPARHPVVASVLVGCRTPAEVDDNADMFAWDIPEDLWAELT